MAVWASEQGGEGGSGTQIAAFRFFSPVSAGEEPGEGTPCCQATTVPGDGVAGGVGHLTML